MQNAITHNRLSPKRANHMFKSQVTRLPDISQPNGRNSALSKWNNPGPGDYDTTETVNDLGSIMRKSTIINPPHQ